MQQLEHYLGGANEVLRHPAGGGTCLVCELYRRHHFHLGPD